MTEEKATPPELTESPAIVRTHEAGNLRYETHTGRLPLRNDKGEIEALVFFAYYRLESSGNRPLVFCFNGGPGSPSVWLHLGAIGPYRIPMLDGGSQPPPPHEPEFNPETWLHFGDLVFIDPIGTGYSVAKSEEIAEKFWSMSGDVESMAEFIRLFLTRFSRFNSELFIAGESYGTTRAAGLAENLTRRGIDISGLILVSAVLDFHTIRFSSGNDLPYCLYLPTYAATAWYHNRIDTAAWGSFDDFLAEVEHFASDEYRSMLWKGRMITDEELGQGAKLLNRYTGLSEEYLCSCYLRPYIMRFCKELARKEGYTVGRLDSRIIGFDSDEVKDDILHDPSMSALNFPYLMAINHYLRNVLGYESDDEYLVFKGIKKPWKWDVPQGGHPNVVPALQNALVQNRFMRVFIASGYYDLATPYFATDYTFSRLEIPKGRAAQIDVKKYPAGHMMYTLESALSDLASDVKSFIESQ